MASVPKSRIDCQAPSSTDEILIPDVIPYLLPGGGISILAGSPNVGKTALLATLVRDLRDQRLIFGHQPRALPGIGVINTDRGWAKGAGLWFARAGYGDVVYYSLSDDRTFNMKRLRKRLDRTDILFSFIDGLFLPPESLVYVDPISIFLGGNLLDYDACAIATGEIRAYLRERRLTMLAAAHSAKLRANKQDRYMRMQDQVLGSTAISGFTDSALYLASPQETGKAYYTLVWHPHGSKEERYYLERDEQGLFIPYTGVDTGTQMRVLALFPDNGGEVGLTALVEAAGAIPLSKATVKRGIDALLDDGTIERVKHGLYRRITVN